MDQLTLLLVLTLCALGCPASYGSISSYGHEPYLGAYGGYDALTGYAGYGGYGQPSYQKSYYGQSLQDFYPKQYASYGKGMKKKGVNGRHVPIPAFDGFTCPASFGRFRHASCKRYYVCYWGYAFSIYCSSHELYDVLAQRCVRSELANCKDQDGTNSTTTTSPAASSTTTLRPTTAALSSTTSTATTSTATSPSPSTTASSSTVQLGTMFVRSTTSSNNNSAPPPL